MELKDLKWTAGWNLSFFCSLCSAFSPIGTLVVVQSLSRVWLCSPWTTARQAPKSSTVSRNLLRFMSIKSVMPSNHLNLCRPLLLLPSIFPSIGVFSNESVLIWWQASVSVLPMKIQDWVPLGWTGWISLRSKGLSRVFSAPQFESISTLDCYYILFLSGDRLHA